MTMPKEIELLVREKRRQEVKRNPVPDVFRRTAVDIADFYEREVLVTLFRRSDFTCYSVAVLESIVLNLAL